MLKLLGISVAMFAVVTFTDVMAESPVERAAAIAQPASDLIWFHDDFWADPALTDEPILKTSTASIPMVYDEAKVIEAQEYLRAVADEIDANLLWDDNADLERNRF